MTHRRPQQVEAIAAGGHGRHGLGHLSPLGFRQPVERLLPCPGVGPGSRQHAVHELLRRLHPLGPEGLRALATRGVQVGCQREVAGGRHSCGHVHDVPVDSPGLLDDDYGRQRVPDRRRPGPVGGDRPPFRVVGGPAHGKVHVSNPPLSFPRVVRVMAYG